MTALHPVAFGIVVWGTVLLVLLVFIYVLVAIARDFGWIQSSPWPGD